MSGFYPVHSIPFRHVWPAKPDLMARLAGMRLRGCRGGRKGERLTTDSTTHVSVWERTA
jgi:hypothetical protein